VADKTGGVVDEEYAQRIFDYLKAKGATAPCPRCRGTAMAILGFTNIGAYSRAEDLKVATRYHAVVVACNRCIYLMPHAVDAGFPKPREGLPLA
jgi:hypothetical protein